MVVGTLPWLWMILTPRPGPGGVSAVPFRDLALLATAPPSVVSVQVGGNLLVFSALGAMLPVRFSRLARPAGLAVVAGVAAGGSLTVEVLQYALALGRVSSIDDVMMNTAGALVGAVVSRPWWAPSLAVRTVPR
ncbi:VanZ family protein [Spongiactinospora sp. TRM90649]|uniref:VanZ family protein n=1 Tax=Spongiactinospora sp. TRM90649 TaxID=3031114 RepID=UPI0023F74625|nr:VanZ family protein [Spongiactinospora sp. TRM90649]MDF5759289.1 VanZ family protein [Spongiactinospora sp. TRM90649]